jgi:hypothetical protein
MKRKLFNHGTLASLLLLGATLYFWNHSSRHTDQVTLHGVGGASLQMTASGGQFMFASAAHNDGKSGGQLSWNSSDDAGDGKLMTMSFTFDNHSKNGTTLILPMWALAFFFAVAPGVWTYSKFKKKGGKKKPSDGH